MNSVKEYAAPIEPVYVSLPSTEFIYRQGQENGKKS